MNNENKDEILINRTNNPLERFYRELKKRISLRPSMPEFITVIKAISNEYVIEIKNIARLGGRVKKHQKPRRKEKATEHKIPDDYINFII